MSETAAARLTRPTEFEGPHRARTPTTITGIVERGQQLGRVLGFPTANVRVAPELAGLVGVYAVRCDLDGRRLHGAASLGCNPTVPKDAPVLEVWLFDFDEDIYDRVLITELAVFLRQEMKFESLHALRAQVMRDGDMARRALAGADQSIRARRPPD